MQINTESTLTDRYQTTIPETVRRALHLNKRDKIRFTVKDDGEVIVSKVEVDDDPAIGKFLNFLADDIANNPSHIQGLSENLQVRIHHLTQGVELDLDSPLNDEDDSN